MDLPLCIYIIFHGISHNCHDHSFYFSGEIMVHMYGCTYICIYILHMYIYIYTYVYICMDTYTVVTCRTL
jgi:hypothetical protein